MRHNKPTGGKPTKLGAVIDISLTSSAPSKTALVLGVVPSDSGPILAQSVKLQRNAPDIVAALAHASGVSGKLGECVRVPGDSLGREIVVLVGLGKTQSPESLRQAAGIVTRTLTGIDELAIALPTPDEEAIQAIAEGLALGAYRFDRYTSKPAAADRAAIVTSIKSGAKDAIKRARIIAQAVNATRELVNTAPNDLYPESFAQHASTLASTVGLSATVLDEKKLAAGGFGGILAVGTGSVRPPRLVKIEYSPRKPAAHVALVGKGITFDSGGLSLKPPLSMETMKSDMAGAASVLNTIAAVAQLKIPVKVTAWLALAENMPSGQATRPSDVITIRGGTTVEVLNTDAEGRLVLADALVAAAEENPDSIIDIATLTGAQIIALGNRIAGVMGTENTRSALCDAAKSSGEEFWPMPLPGQLDEGLKSQFADLKNKGAGREGGMLTGGLFLQHFVGDHEWAHLDVAGPAWSDKPWGYVAAGGTGMGVRTLVAYIDAVSRKASVKE